MATPSTGYYHNQVLDTTASTADGSAPYTIDTNMFIYHDEMSSFQHALIGTGFDEKIPGVCTIGLNLTKSVTCTLKNMRLIISSEVAGGNTYAPLNYEIAITVGSTDTPDEITLYRHQNYIMYQAVTIVKIPDIPNLIIPAGKNVFANIRILELEASAAHKACMSLYSRAVVDD